MYPIIFDFQGWPLLDGLRISSYGLMMVVAFLVCNKLLRIDLSKKGLNPNIADDIIFRAAIGGIIGAKIYYLIEFPGSTSELLNASSIVEAITIFGSGLVFLGGLIGGMISVTLYLRKNNIKWLEAADWVAPYLALGHAIGRIGCFLVGDCQGSESHLPWAVQFPEIAGIGTAHLHPAQLYECAAYTMVFVYLIYIRSKKTYTGLLMFEYLFLVGLSRFLIEFVRVNNPVLGILTGAQVISIIMMVIGSYFMYINRSKLKQLSV